MSQHPSIAAIGAPPAQFNLAAYVIAKADETPDKTALVLGDGQSWTYRALRVAVENVAAGLLQRGIQPDDRILMRLGNKPDFPFVFLGAIYAGIIPIPTSAMLTRPEVTKIVTETSPVAIIGRPDTVHCDLTIAVVSPTELQATGQVEPVFGDPERPAYIVYTSGTSGTPRAVVHAHRAIWARRMMWDGWYGLNPTDVVLHAGAFNWTYTLGTGLLDPWACGATAVIPEDGTQADMLPELLCKHRATIFAAAPGIFRRMLRSDMPALPNLRHGLSAGEKLPRVIAEAWQQKTGTPVFEAYGMSECSTFISSRPGRRSDGLGWPQPGRDVALIGSNGPVASGERGQIAIHKDDPGLMLGYLNAPVETSLRFQGDWFLTGDIGHIGADGAIHYDGRVDDMMNAGGYRVSPIEVESVLATHPTISECAACEVAVSADTHIIVAFYVAANVLDEAKLAAHCAASLAAYKVPRAFVRIEKLPRGANNKILRKVLRDDWETTHGQT